MSHPRTGTTYYGSFRQAARALVVAPENSSGYDRDQYFGDWKDLNGDCQNTRAEVLIQESTVRPTFSSSSRGCTVATGRWVTSFDNEVHTSASTVQIDHMVPRSRGMGIRGEKLGAEAPHRLLQRLRR